MNPLALMIPREIDEVEHHVVGNGMRLDGDHRIALDERWRGARGPGADRVAEFEAVAGALNRECGYR